MDGGKGLMSTTPLGDFNVNVNVIDNVKSR